MIQTTIIHQNLIHIRIHYTQTLNKSHIRTYMYIFPSYTVGFKTIVLDLAI